MMHNVFNSKSLRLKLATFVSSDRNAQQRGRDESGEGRMLTRFKSGRPDYF